MCQLFLNLPVQHDDMLTTSLFDVRHSGRNTISDIQVTEDAVCSGDGNNLLDFGNKLFQLEI